MYASTLIHRIPWPGAGFTAQGHAFGARLLLEPAETQGDVRWRLLHADVGPLGEGGDWVCILTELTDLHQDCLREEASTQQLAHVLDLLRPSMALFDRRQTVLYGNWEYARVHKLEPTDLPGMSVAQVLKSNDAMTRPYREELFRTGQPVRYERLLRDFGVDEQLVIEVQLWPIKDAQDAIDKVAVLTKEVTLRHQGMEALRQTLERLDRLFEAGIEGIVLFENGVVIDANPIACRQLGIAREALLAQSLPQVLHALGVPPLDGGGPAPLRAPELTRLPGHAGEPPLEILGVELPGEPVRAHALLLRDLSYRLDAQQQINRLVADLRAQKARAEAADRGKSVFLASASHDLRQPIHALGLFLSSLQSLSASDGPVDANILACAVQGPEALPADAATAAAPPPAVGKHILLVDDDEQVLLATASLLESWGHSVRCASNASEVIRLWENEPQRVDAVICDCVLGPTVDVFELLLRLRMGRPGPLPICMITGDMSMERTEQARRHGFALLHKPVSANELKRFLQAEDSLTQ